MRIQQVLLLSCVHILPKCMLRTFLCSLISKISVGATPSQSFDYRLPEPYLCDGARLRQQFRPLLLGLLGVMGVALTLEDKHYLPQVWRSTNDKD